jgi:hypothetical protein
MQRLVRLRWQRSVYVSAIRPYDERRLSVRFAGGSKVGGQPRAYNSPISTNPRIYGSGCNLRGSERHQG